MVTVYDLTLEDKSPGTFRGGLYTDYFGCRVNKPGCCKARSGESELSLGIWTIIGELYSHILFLLLKATACYNTKPVKSI